MLRPLAHHPHKMAMGLASLGRGGDSTLVHMSPNEVAGLQKLAMAHGGSLTINPHTGLPEAGFLSSILPMIAGIGLNFLLPGLGAAGAGLLTGAATGAVEGDWKKGLMAGLGAFGGYGLGNALTSVGADAAKVGATELSPVSLSPTATRITTTPGLDLLNGASGATTAATNAINPIASSAAFDTAQAAGASDLATSGATEAADATNMVTGATKGQNFMSGLKALGEHPLDTSKAIYKDLGQSAGLGSSKLANAAVAASAAAPIMNQIMQQPTLDNTSANNKNYYYVPAAGYKSLYSPGTVNPDIAKLGYLPAGEAAFTGQQFNPGVLTNTPPYPVVNPAPGFASGGQIPVAPQNQTAADYYSSLLAAPSKSSILPPPPPPDAMNQYLSNLTKMVTPQTVNNAASQSTSQPAAQPSTPTYSTPSSIPSSLTGSLGNTINLPHYTFNPVTGTFTEVGGNTNPYAPSGDRGKASLGNPFSDNTDNLAYNTGGSIQDTYAAGGKLLRGPGDGMSDSIPAVIHGQKPQRAALADGEFVIPADVVSHLGNGSTEAGSRKLYEMMDKVRRARTGNPKQGRQINPNKFIPA